MLVCGLGDMYRVMRCVKVEMEMESKWGVGSRGGCSLFLFKLREVGHFLFFCFFAACRFRVQGGKVAHFKIMKEVGHFLLSLLLLLFVKVKI